MVSDCGDPGASDASWSVKWWGGLFLLESGTQGSVRGVAENRGMGSLWRLWVHISIAGLKSV